jgi:hypothetical protein
VSAVGPASASPDLLSRQQRSAGISPFRSLRSLLTKGLVVLLTLSVADFRFLST